MRAEELTRRLKERARAEGFDLVSVARAGSLERDRAALEAWLREDRQAAMVWMARDPGKRADPRRLLPGCRSVVALAMNYRTREERKAAGSPTPAGPRVARYAEGRDYHRVLGARAGRVSAWLERESGRAARSFVDTGPVLERAWAERAGMGWIGKNSCLLTEACGSWLLLAEILCVAELDPDPGPHADQCGTCTACVEACPTDAIVRDGVVDSNLCIAYWTIEHRGPLPVERRADVGEWIFGCDVCQEVCPWNRRFSKPVADGRFEVREDLRAPDAAEILGMDEGTFRRRFSGTSLMRAKWEGMRRNACLVLGNLGDPEALPVLRRALGDGDPVVRSHAAWAVRRIHDLSRGGGSTRGEAN